MWLVDQSLILGAKRMMVKYLFLYFSPDNKKSQYLYIWYHINSQGLSSLQSLIVLASAHALIVLLGQRLFANLF